MSQFAVGDRVTWMGSSGIRGHGAVRGEIDGDILVKPDDDVATVCVPNGEGLEADEPQEWQGECQMCAAWITPSTSCPYRLPAVGRLVNVCPSCWETHTEDDRGLPALLDADALAASRRWMAERYPDEPKWQETT